MISLRSRLATLVAAVFVALVVAAPAGASVKFGSSMLGPVDSSTCNAAMGFTQNCTLALATLPPANQEAGGTVAPSDGVIVAWTLRSGNSLIEPKIRLRVIRGATAVATGPQEALPLNGGFNNFLARISVKAGDKIGIDTLGVTELQSVPVVRNLAGASFELWFPPLADGQSFAPTSTKSNFELMLNATLEPDADKDGWGDETQDKCAGKAGTDKLEGCPEPAVCVCLPGSGPDTKFGKKGTKGVSTTRKATFRFSATVAGSTFQCKLDKKPWKACKSPKIYRSLQEGRHTFKVRAVGPTGLVDPSPAKRSFKVEL